jgi:starch synthase
VGALAVEFSRLGHDVALLIPGYQQVDVVAQNRKEVTQLSVHTEDGPRPCTVQQLSAVNQASSGGRLRTFALYHEEFFNRAELYQEAGQDYSDNLERFAFFCRAVMEFLIKLAELESWSPEVLHVHDWQTALCAVYLKTLYEATPSLRHLQSVLTLHNLGYQGLFPVEKFGATGLPQYYFTPRYLEFFGSINLLKGGIVFADMLTTVSPTYSREIQTKEYGFGLEGVLADRKDDLYGIVNGIDDELWDPRTDHYLDHQYSAGQWKGKALCKTELQRELGLPRQRVPLLAIIARLTSQKGIDLVIDLLPELVEMNAQIVVLGTGEYCYERQLHEWAQRYPKRISFLKVFDERMAHRIEASADIFLMPSRYEPCGLSQMYSLRYGTVPIVRKTGGLADTVTNYTPLSMKEMRATGFTFIDPNSEVFLTTIMLALQVFHNKTEWKQLAVTGMAQELSWRRSAGRYIDLFRVGLQKGPRRLW